MKLKIEPTFQTHLAHLIQIGNTSAERETVERMENLLVARQLRNGRNRRRFRLLFRVEGR